jgi:NADH:ubiquinone oxidoreductase subunit 6 (subunit J)
VSTRSAAASGLLVGLLVLGAAWLFELPLARTAALAPVLVLFAAAVGGLVVFWARAARESLREARHPRLIVGGIVALVVVGIVVTILGIELPRE